MDDAHGVHRLEGVQHVAAELERLLVTQRSARDPLRQRLALHVVHHVVEEPACLARPVDRHHVRVVHVGKDARLAQEPFRGLGGGEFRAHDLDRNLAVELHVPRQEHDPHPATGELSLHLVVRE